MSNGDDPIIICGTAGDEQGTVQIAMFKGSVAGIADAFSPSAAQSYPGVTERDVKRLKHLFEHAHDHFFEELERLGIPYTKHDHPAPQ